MLDKDFKPKDRHVALWVAAIFSAVTTVTLIAVLGILVMKMTADVPQVQTVRTVQQGDLNWICLETLEEDRIVAESCTLLDDPITASREG